MTPPPKPGDLVTHRLTSQVMVVLQTDRCGPYGAEDRVECRYEAPLLGQYVLAQGPLPRYIAQWFLLVELDRV
jgi:hypothetical protein